MVNSGQVNRVDLQLHSIVAIPWFTDNMEIWTSTGLTSGQLQKIAPYAKINECGILYASRIHRDDKPEGHDYFSYAARLVTEGKTKTIEESLLLTAQHEGAHGPVDEITQKLLKTTDATCIYEGIAGSLGDDRRDLVKTNTPFTVLIENPCVFAKPEDMQERIYIFGAKFFSAVRNTLKDKNHTDNDVAWITIFSILLKLSLELSTDKTFLNKDENSKVSFFLQEFLERSRLSRDELRTHYQILNT